MLVYGLTKHLIDMVKWHQDLGNLIERIYDNQEKHIIEQMDLLDVEIVSDVLLKKIQKGTQIIISDMSNYDELETHVLEINPGLDCIGIDEYYAEYCVKKAYPNVNINESINCTTFEYKLKEVVVFWGALELKDILHYAKVRRIIATKNCLVVDTDSNWHGKTVADIPVCMSTILLEKRGEASVIVLSEAYNTIRMELVSYGYRENEDFFDGRLLVGKNEIKKTYKDYPELKLPKVREPLVSIVITAHNNWDYTYNCIRSIIENTKDIAYEVILADGKSVDNTIYADIIVRNLVISRSTMDVGHLMNCNRGGKQARGKYIHMLDNDTVVRPGWLSSLLSLIEENDDIGLVGSKLLAPDGRLHEAGSLLWKDATGWNYGKFQDPYSEEFQYVKDVDFISGCSILIRKKLWDEIGGFDVRFIPAYCDDSDLAFSVRKYGYRVVYQPLSEVVHYEGLTNGRNTEVGLKQYEPLNSVKFKNKWQKELAKHPADGQDVFWARDRSYGKKTIVIVDMWIPAWDQNSSARTVYQYVKLFLKMGLHVIFVNDNYCDGDRYTTEFRQLGVEVLSGEGWSIAKFAEWLDLYGKYIDYAYLQRPGTAIKYIDIFRSKTKAKILFYPMDIASLREERQYQYDRRPETLTMSKVSRALEDELFNEVDVIHMVGDRETRIVQERYPSKIVHNIPVFLYKHDYLSGLKKPSLKNRENIIFVANLNHLPNPDGAVWFVKKILPLIQKKNKCKFYLIGSPVKEEIRNLETANVVITGHVSDLELDELYSHARVAVVPLRYGAGVKGKVVEAMAMQVPVVTTGIGAEGLAGIEKYIDVAETEKQFAEYVLRYLIDDEYWQQKANHIIDYIKDNFTYDVAEKILLEDIIP